MKIDWLPDESVFSLCARFGRLAGHRLAAQTTLDLFQHHRLGSAHDFPCRVEHLAHRFDGQLGTSESIIRQHTILPFFLPFITEDRAASAVKTLQGSRQGSLKYSLGILTTGFRAAHPLKACPDCVAEDVTDRGLAHWRISHQIPGTWFCSRHQTSLLYSGQKINQVSRFLYFTPHDAQLRPWRINAPSLSEVAAGTLLAGVVREIHDEGAAGRHYAPEQYSLALHANLVSRGFAKRTGRLDSKLAARNFEQFCRPLQSFPDFHPVPRSVEDAERWINSQIRKPRAGTHPLRRAITIAWLFGSFKTFAQALSRHDQVVRTGQGLELGKRNDSIAERKSLAFLERVRSGSSVRKAAIQAGISVQTGLALAAEAGIPIQCRPSKLTGAVQAQLEAAFLKGIQKVEIERKTGLSRPTIDRFLRRRPDLAAAHASAIFAKTQRAMRVRWERLLRQHPTLGLKALRLVGGDVFSWLYRHDREWLIDHRPPAARKTPAASRVDWDQRDEMLAQKVRETVERLSQIQKGRQVTIRMLREEIHELALAVRRLERFPRTAKQLDRIRL